MKYRRKLNCVDAIKAVDAMYAAEHAWESLPSWLRDAYDRGRVIFSADRVLLFSRYDDWLAAFRADWIIRDETGHLYPQSAESFKAMYEQIDNTPEADHAR